MLANWLAGLDVAVGVLVILLALPLYRGKVGRNWVYGVRFRASFASDEAWYAINRYGARQLMLWSSLLVILGGVVLLLPLENRPWLPIALVLLPAALLLPPCVLSYRYARRYGEGP